MSTMSADEQRGGRIGCLFVVRQDVRAVAQHQLQSIEPRYKVVRGVAGTG